MAVPKKKTSSSKRDMRRSHHAMKQPNHIMSCNQCGEPTLMHRVCKSCGFYKGKEIVNITIE